ncbi:MAG: F0F1 ATP synthase subunit delta [Gammaproteobacteria bacterium]|nr:F0F1 ATP synthase subunit delta [Gammaproteobacteria bacterium]
MIEKATIARPYAQAVFELARDDDTLDQWSAFLKRLGMIVSDPVMRAVINNPRLDEEKLIDLITELCGDTALDSGRNFIRVLVQAGRLGVAKEIYELFETRRAEHTGLSEVEVISAFPLTDEQKDSIRNIMSKRLGASVEINSDVNQDLIGGVIIRAGDSVIDASVRGRLQELTNEFAS